MQRKPTGELRYNPKISTQKKVRKQEQRKTTTTKNDEANRKQIENGRPQCMSVTLNVKRTCTPIKGRDFNTG